MNTKIPLINNSLEFSTKFSFNNSNVETFESTIEKYLGDRFFFTALNSATSAIHLALILSGVKEGDEVICPSFTFAATAYPILYLKAKPVFIDSEYETWNMCPVTLREAILNRIKNNKKPKAIIVVHSYGMPAKMNKIMSISKEFEIPVIEDAAGALGAVYDHKKCGTMGDFGVFSFNNNKILTTFGGGGLISKHNSLKDKALFYATQAKETEPYYKHSEIGYNYRMSPVAAAVGIQEFRKLEFKMGSKKNVYSYYLNLFDTINGIALQKRPNDLFRPNYWLSSIIVNKEIYGFSNIDLKNQLQKSNIESRYLWNPLHLQPIFKKCLYFGNQIAENLFQNGLSLPSGFLEHNELERISSSIKKLV